MTTAQKTIAQHLAQHGYQVACAGADIICSRTIGRAAVDYVRVDEEGDATRGRINSGPRAARPRPRCPRLSWAV